MRKRMIATMGLLAGLVLSLQADLIVKPAPLKIVGQKAVIKLELKNTFTNAVESARAAVFIMDEQGKVYGQATRWVIGGTKDRPALEPDQETTFHFVVPLGGELSTNLQAQVQFNRVILQGGKVADARKEIQIVK